MSKRKIPKSNFFTMKSLNMYISDTELDCENISAVECIHWMVCMHDIIAIPTKMLPNQFWIVNYFLV